MVLFLEAAIIAGIFMRAAYVPAASEFVSSHLGRAVRPLVGVLVVLTVAAGSLAALGSHELEKTSHLSVQLAPSSDETSFRVSLQADGQRPVELVLASATLVLVPAAFEKTVHNLRVTVDGDTSTTFQVLEKQPLQLTISPSGAEASLLAVATV